MPLDTESAQLTTSPPAREELLGGKVARSGWRADLAALGGYILLALIFTWPLPMVVGSATMGSGTDAWQETWEMWWMNRAIQTGSPPYHFSTLYAPDGATNYLHSFNPIETLLVLPVQWAFGPIPAYNVACWMALFLTGIGGYLLARDVTGSRTAGFVAGLALGFAPHQFAQLLGHLDVASIQFFVLGVWCLYRSFHALGRRSIVWVLWSAVCLAASALSHPYSLISSIIVMVLMGLGWSFGRTAVARRSEARRPAPLRLPLPSLQWQPAAKAGVALVVGLAVVSPLLFAMQSQRVGPNAVGRWESNSTEIGFFSADLASYFLPSTFHPIWGNASVELSNLIKGGNAERVVYPGYTVMALALVGAFARSTRRKALFWWLLGICGALLSFGPKLHILGNDTGLPMPSALFYSLPGSSILRVPARFSILLLIGLSVCAALGVYAIWKRWLANQPHRYHILAIIPLLVALELLPAPYPVSKYQVEPWYTTVGSVAGEHDAVLEVPFDRGDPYPLAWQITSGLPLAGGYMSRQPLYPLSSGVPPFTDFGLNRFHAPLFFSRSRDTLCTPRPGEATHLDVMRLAKVRYLALHLDRLKPEDPRIAMASRLFSTPPVYRSNNLIVYDTGAGDVPDDLFGAVEDTEDWMGAVEEGRFKWTTSTYARIHFWSGAERQAELHFKLTSFQYERNVVISLGDALLGAGSVDREGRQFDVDLRVPRGFSTVLITSSGLAVSPASLGMNNDTRPLTVKLSDCSYLAK